jgi:hypothetical protein
MKLFHFAILGAVFLSACDSGLQDRVKTLEERVAKLERGNTTSSVSPQPATLANQTSSAEEGQAPEFKFAETFHDFGTITEGDVVTHTFAFTNEGEAPLIIKNARASCGCTVPKYPKTPIGPGEEGEILVQFNSTNKPGTQNKTVTLTANTNPPTSQLRIRSVVNPKGSGVAGPTK